MVPSDGWQLLAAIRAGDIGAEGELRKLYEATIRRIRRRNFRMLDEEDALQTVSLQLVSAFRKRDFVPGASFDALVSKIATNIMISMRRAQWVRTRDMASADKDDKDEKEAPSAGLGEGWLHAVRLPDGEDHAIRKQLRVRIEAALEGLPAGQREAFILVEMEGFKNTEAAEILDISATALGGRLFHARAALRAALAELEQELK